MFEIRYISYKDCGCLLLDNEPLEIFLAKNLH